MTAKTPSRRRLTGRRKPKRRGDDRIEKVRQEDSLRIQRQLLATRDFAEAVIEAVPPLLVLDDKLRVHTANESFCQHFKISARQAINQPVYELGNGQWNIPELRTLLEKVLPRKSFFKNFEMTHGFETIGRRALRLSGRQVDHLQKILLFIEDVTEQRDSEAALQASEIRYRRLFEAARDGILILDPATRRITDANPFMSELLGYTHDELKGRELWEIGLLKDEKASRSAFRSLQRHHFIRYEDLPLQNKSGEHHEVEFVSNLYDEGSHKVIQCNIRDITDRKRTEEILRASEERFRALFDLGPVAIYSCDASGKIREFNRRCAELWGRKPKTGDASEQFYGCNKLTLPDGTDQPRGQCLMAEVLCGNIPLAQDVEVVIERPDHSRIVALVNIAPLKNERGEITGAINCFYDITERINSERALLAAKNEIGHRALQLEQIVADRTVKLRETISDLEEFSYSVSHDMRAPLRAMQSFAAFLSNEYGGKLDRQGQDYLEQIIRSAVRLDRLIQDVLSYTRIFHPPLPIGTVNLDQLVRDIIETYPNGSPIKPLIEIRHSLPTVLGNVALLTQCFSNLLSNAVKFVPSGKTPHIEISAVPAEDGAIRVLFKDNGIGIAPEDHGRIFRLFERVHPCSEYEGTGIGLTIVRKAVERMGARVGFESELGQGSTFWIQLKKV